MIHQLISLDNKLPFVLACSGGVDSMAIADFYKRGNKNFTVAYFNHGTPQSLIMQSVVEKWAQSNNIPCAVGHLTRDKQKDESPEEYWRDERYAWLKSFNKTIVTCHHLDDVVETWIFSSLHGNPKTIAIKNNNVLRPFLLNKKSVLKDWCIKHNITWAEDQSNLDINFPRNRIRHNLIPEALKINPGLHKVIKKKILQSKQCKHERKFLDDNMNFLCLDCNESLGR